MFDWIKPKANPKVGDHRVVRFFIFFPMTLPISETDPTLRTRCLHRVNVVQEWRDEYWGKYEYTFHDVGWFNVAWAPEEATDET